MLQEFGYGIYAFLRSKNKLYLIKTLFLGEGDGACMMRTITDAHIAPTGQKIEFIYQTRFYGRGFSNS